MKPEEINILIGCEESQEVCKAFRELGFNAFSCDIQDCSGGHPEWHIKGDVFEAINSKEWHCGIFFPPCTDIAVSGSRYFAKKIANCDIDFFSIENPVGIMSTHFRKPNQIIQPYQFGHKSKKTTCIWLNNLPKLISTDLVEPNIITMSNGKKFSADYMIGVKRSKAGESSTLRSKTFPGIAQAMAQQWGDYLIETLKHK